MGVAFFIGQSPTEKWVLLMTCIVRQFSTIAPCQTPQQAFGHLTRFILFLRDSLPAHLSFYHWQKPTSSYRYIQTWWLENAMCYTLFISLHSNFTKVSMSLLCSGVAFWLENVFTIPLFDCSWRGSNLFVVISMHIFLMLSPMCCASIDLSRIVLGMVTSLEHFSGNSCRRRFLYDAILYLKKRFGRT